MSRKTKRRAPPAAHNRRQPAALESDLSHPPKAAAALPRRDLRRFHGFIALASALVTIVCGYFTLHPSVMLDVPATGARASGNPFGEPLIFTNKGYGPIWNMQAVFYPLV